MLPKVSSRDTCKIYNPVYFIITYTHGYARKTFPAFGAIILQMEHVTTRGGDSHRSGYAT